MYYLAIIEGFWFRRRQIRFMFPFLSFPCRSTICSINPWASLFPRLGHLRSERHRDEDLAEEISSNSMSRWVALLLSLTRGGVAPLPTSQDIGLCGLAAGLIWEDNQGFPISHSGWTCTSLGYANLPCSTWTGIVCKWVASHSISRL